jgi:hypothetical protein
MNKLWQISKSRAHNFQNTLNAKMSESQMHLSLSVKGLQRLESVSHEKDFAFIVGNERYCRPSFVAEFLSP